MLAVRDQEWAKMNLLVIVELPRRVSLIELALNLFKNIQRRERDPGWDQNPSQHLDQQRCSHGPADARTDRGLDRSSLLEQPPRLLLAFTLLKPALLASVAA